MDEIVSNKHNPLVSVILPTYNVAEYLRQCLDSIIKQTFKNIEVIIVIDGATDGSLEIAKEYAEKDSRFSVYWQENVGSGPARNKGLQYANGEFIIFVDPDDWIEYDFIEKLIKTQKKGNYDLVISGRQIRIYKSNTIVKTSLEMPKAMEISNDKKSVRQQYLNILCSRLIGAPTMKLYRTSIISNGNIKFPALRRSQDIIFNYHYYDKIKSLCIVNYAGYNYRVAPKERLSRLKSGYEFTIIKIYNEIVDLHTQWGINLNIKVFATYILENFIIPLVESQINIKANVSSVLNNEQIIAITRIAASNKTYQHFMRLAIVNKWYMCIKLMVNVRNLIRQYI